MATYYDFQTEYVNDYENIRLMSPRVQTILVASSLHMHWDWLQCLSFLSV